MKNVSDPARLRALLGTAALARVRARLRKRLQRTGALQGTLTLDAATPEERSAVDAIFGHRPTTGRLVIHLAELECTLRNARIADTLIDAVEGLEGPILSARDASMADDLAWRTLEAAMLGAARTQAPSAVAWCSELVGSGLLRRLSRGSHEDARRWFDQALGILRQLPFRGVRLAHLAADICGDSHALDEGEPLGTIVVRALEHGLELVGTEVSRRDAFAKAGILTDDVSAPVLVLNLRASSAGLLATTLNRYADAGEPLHISPRQLIQEDLHFGYSRGDTVFACENPTVLAAAADALGRACRPLICTSGQARTATRELIRRLGTAGVRVLYHGDFDWPGLTIARGLIGRGDAEPWRLSATDYARGAAGPTLKGQSVETPWDPSLTPAMIARGVAVHEEAVLSELLADLALA